VTEKDFRRIALGLTGAVEGAHMDHPDFRSGGRIFATLHPDREWGMVKLTPDQQADFVSRMPGVFVPENGAWGRQGYTAVRLSVAGEEIVGEALTLAHRNTVRTVSTSTPKKRGIARSRRTSRP
jgi:hypothetical protein